MSGAATRSTWSRLKRKLTDLLISEVPGPSPDGTPPDIDGRRDTDDMDHDHAVLDAQLHAKGSAGMGGTIVSWPHDGSGPPG